MDAGQCIPEEEPFAVEFLKTMVGAGAFRFCASTTGGWSRLSLDNMVALAYNTRMVASMKARWSAERKRMSMDRGALCAYAAAGLDGVKRAGIRRGENQ